MTTTSLQEIIAGRKVFFITPDTHILPKSFCEDYLAQGYECYFVENDKKVPLSVKIDIIVSVFKDVILFFNVDYEIKGISWPIFISNLQERFHGQIPIGCLFGKRQAKNEKQNIERKYIYDLNLTCGCIQLEYQKKLNFEIIEKVLYAYQATGRRKNIRAMCNSTCTFTFDHKGIPYNGILKDISLSHFSFVFPEGKLILKEYEKIDHINFVVKGCHFTSNAVLCMNRLTEEGDRLFVFTFVNDAGTHGMDSVLKERFSPFLYQLMHENCTNLLESLYKVYMGKRYTNNYDNDSDESEEEVADVLALLEREDLDGDAELEELGD